MVSIYVLSEYTWKLLTKVRKLSQKLVYARFLLHIFKLSLKHFVYTLFCSLYISTYNNATVFFQILFNKSKRAVGVEFMYRGKVS